MNFCIIPAYSCTQYVWPSDCTVWIMYVSLSTFLKSTRTPHNITTKAILSINDINLTMKITKASYRCLFGLMALHRPTLQVITTSNCFFTLPTPSTILHSDTTPVPTTLNCFFTLPTPSIILHSDTTPMPTTSNCFFTLPTPSTILHSDTTPIPTLDSYPPFYPSARVHQR